MSTGVFETIEREQLVDLLVGCGARYYSGMSPNLDYLLVGRDAGPVKLQVAQEKGITQLSESEFFEWIKDRIANYDAAAKGEADEKPAAKGAGKAAVKKQTAGKASKAQAGKREPTQTASSAGKAKATVKAEKRAVEADLEAAGTEDVKPVISGKRGKVVDSTGVAKAKVKVKAKPSKPAKKTGDSRSKKRREDFVEEGGSTDGTEGKARRPRHRLTRSLARAIDRLNV